MKFNDIFNEKMELFEAVKKKKPTDKKKSTKDKKKVDNKKTTKKKTTKKKDVEHTTYTDKLIFPTEERAILNLGDTVALVTKLMGDIEKEIKTAAKAKDTAKADQLERKIDIEKEKLEKLMVAEKKAVEALVAKIDDLLKDTEDEEYIKVLKTTRKKYKK